jgi:hypothetical protein
VFDFGHGTKVVRRGVYTKFTNPSLYPKLIILEYGVKSNFYKINRRRT